MAKASGNTRNYSGNTKVLNTRMAEYYSLISQPEYDRLRSYFDDSGGFVVTHKDHNQITNHDEDKSDIAVKVLASKGYKVYLDAEKSFIEGDKMPDGRVYRAVMDIKTINMASKYKIKNALEDAATQGATTAVLYQNTTAMTRKYVEAQIKEYQMHSPVRLRHKINRVIVVGLSGRVHIHNI